MAAKHHIRRRGQQKAKGGFVGFFISGHHHFQGLEISRQVDYCFIQQAQTHTIAGN
ncbi:hypothetical protein [Chitinophaga parva]|uniref:hypothetical protein n=1 Tax=Chitinophaga parva TaxID=2169414 RepID=UPI001402D1BF|nr:hypothetical protein [Chitinophaga parva]